MTAGCMAKLKRTENTYLSVRTNREQLADIYDRYYDRIYKFLLLRVFNIAYVQDLSAEVFLKAAAALESFKGNTEKDLCNWLYTIAANSASTFLKQKARRAEILQDLARTRIHLAAAKSEPVDLERLDWPRLYEAIAMLNQRQQTVITMRFFEDMEYEQIGKILKIKPGSVRVTCFRALRKLEEILGDSFGG